MQTNTYTTIRCLRKPCILNGLGFYARKFRWYQKITTEHGKKWERVNILKCTAMAMAMKTAIAKHRVEIHAQITNMHLQIYRNVILFVSFTRYTKYKHKRWEEVSSLLSSGNKVKKSPYKCLRCTMLKDTKRIQNCSWNRKSLAFKNESTTMKIACLFFGRC